MTLKFSRTSGTRTRLTIADAVALTLPNSDWTVGCIIVFNGEMAGYGGTTQWLMSNTEGGSTGSFLLAWYPLDVGDATRNGRFVLNFNSSVTDRCLSAPVEAGKAYLIAAQRSNGQVTTKLCPVLLSEPATGAAVTTSATSPLAAALDSTTPWNFGDRSTTGRRCDQTLGRFFRIDRALSDLEIAKLAYGYQITDLGTPAFNILGNDPANIVDTGPNNFAITVSGPPAQGADPGFGYNGAALPPTIDGSPTISGGAVVGQAKGYTPAPIAGTPTPVNTQQWTLDGADIPGATATTYTPTTDDIGKLLRVRQIAVNANGSNSATSNGVVVVSGAVSVAVNELVAEAFYQQTAGTAVVPLSGTFEGNAPASIEYQLYAPDGLTVVKAWADAGAAIGAGTWTASPAMPTPGNGKKYRIAVRSKNSGGGVIFTGAVNVNRFAIGGINMVVGSSTPSGWFGSGTAVNRTPDHDRVSVFNGTWGLFGEYGVASEMAEYMSQQLGYPIAMIDAARGGSGIHDWLNTSGSDWARFNSLLAGVGGKLGAIFGSVGSNDTVNMSSIVSRANHLGNLRLFATRMRTAAGNANLPIIWQGINRRTSPETDELAAEYARMAENDFGDDANVYHYQTLQYVLSSDGVHMAGSQSHDAAMASARVGTDGIKGNYRRGPKIVSYTYSGPGATSAAVTIQHRNGTDYTPTNNITGFTAGDTNGALTVAASRADATHVNLAFNRAVVGPLWIKHLAGKGPDTTAAVMDNGAQSLPMNVETDLAPTVLAETVPPTITGATVSSGSPGVVVLAASEPLDTSSVPAASAFTVSGHTVQSVSIQGSAINLTVTPVFANGEAPRTAAYTVPGANPVRDLASTPNNMAAFSGLAITNNVAAPISTVTGVTINPTAATVAGGATQAFTATAQGTNNPAQTFNWTRNPAVGSVSGNGTASGSFTAPAATNVAQVIEVTATSTQDPNFSAKATVTVPPASPAGTNFTRSLARTIRVRAASQSFEGGPFWNTTNKFRPVGVIDKDETIDVSFDLTEVLADISDTVKQIDFDLAGLTSVGGYFTGAIATVFVSNAVLLAGGKNPTITCKMTTNSVPGRKEDWTVELKIEEQ